jgi:arylsulfatase A-like enzyme
MPKATILDETRYVLREYPPGLVMGASGISVPRGGHLSLRRKLPDSLKGGSRVAMLPGVRDQGASGSGIYLPLMVARVEKDARGEFVQLELDLPKRMAGSKVDLFVMGAVLSEEAQNRYQTPELKILPRSRLEFGVGILEVARAQGPVAFSVQICEAGDCAQIFSETLDPAEPMGRGWQDRVVSLAEYAGKQVSFRFETALLRTDPEAFSLPVWSNATVYSPRRRRADEINVILISIDTLRADHLTSYGYPLETAPFVEERFGKGGTVLENCVSAAAKTGPSHMSMFTSLQPSVHGIKGEFQMVSPAAVTIAEVLRAHGFETGAVTENGALIAGQGFGRGFNSYAENKSANIMLPKGQVDLTFARGRRWLERHKDQRFFLFLHTYQVHYPHVPPKQYQHLFSVPAEGYEPHPELPANRDPARYDREIRYVDDELRKLFHMLDDERLTRNTLVILTSDHGEEFLEHGFMGHGPHVHVEVTHVPLLFWGPGVPKGRRVSQPVAHIDFMPTILELVGVPGLDSGMGRSFADVLRPRGATGSRDTTPVYSEAWHQRGMTVGSKFIPIEQPTLSVRVGDRRLIRYRRGDDFRYEYFDLRSDPREQHDRYDEMKGQVRDLKQLIDTYPSAMASLSGALAQKAGEAALRAEGELPFDPEREEKLRALGYIE